MATHNNKPLDKLILLGIYFVLLKFQIHHVAAVQPTERYAAEIQINSIADKLLLASLDISHDRPINGVVVAYPTSSEELQKLESSGLVFSIVQDPALPGYNEFLRSHKLTDSVIPRSNVAFEYHNNNDVSTLW